MQILGYSLSTHIPGEGVLQVGDFKLGAPRNRFQLTGDKSLSQWNFRTKFSDFRAIVVCLTALPQF